VLLVGCGSILLQPGSYLFNSWVKWTRLCSTQFWKKWNFLNTTRLKLVVSLI